MVIRNTLDKSFGPMAAFAGIALFLAGICFLCHLTGIALLLTGSLLATATDETSIDTSRGRIRSGTRFLGMFTLGKWQDAGDFTGLTLIPVCRSYTAHSLSDRQQTAGDQDFRIYILDKQRKPAYALKKCPTREEAREEMQRLVLILHLPIYMPGE